MIQIITTIGISMATAADWGQLYSLSGDAGLVMPFRSYYIRDFFAGDWNDFAIGLIYIAHGATIPSDLVDERQSETDPSNLFHFGLTTDNGKNQIDSVSENPYFIGLRGILSGVTQITTSPLQLAQLYMTLVNQSQLLVQATPLQLPLNNHGDSNPFSMVGLRFTRDQTNGVVYINWNTQANLNLTADSDDVPALSAFLAAIPKTFSTAVAQFPFGASIKAPSPVDPPTTPPPISIPYSLQPPTGPASNFSTYYIYWPYQLNHLALHCVGAIKFG